MNPTKCVKCYKESHYKCQYCGKNLCYKCKNPLSYVTERDEIGEKEIDTTVYVIYFCIDCLETGAYSQFEHKKDIY